MSTYMGGFVRPEIRPSAPRLFSAPPERKWKMIGVKAHPDLHVRLRKAAVDEGMTYAELLDNLLDLREDRLARQQRSMRSPLHRPDEYQVVDA